MNNNVRRQFLVRMASGLTLTTPASLTQSATQLKNLKPRIAIITFRGPSQVEQGFESYLEEAGIQADFLRYDIGRNLGLVPSILTELRRFKPALLLTWGTSVTQKVTGTVAQPNPLAPTCPVVFVLVTDPVAARIVNSLQGPNPNITGIFHVAALSQQLKIIQQYKAFTRLGILYTPTENNSLIVKAQLEKILNKQGKVLVSAPFNLDKNNSPTAQGVQRILETIQQAGAQWLYLPPDSYLGSQARTEVLPRAHALNLPTFASTEQLMNAGALVGLVCSYFEVGQFAGFKASQILLENKTAGTIPIETLQTYTLRISSAAAHRLGLTPPLQWFGVAKFQEND